MRARPGRQGARAGFKDGRRKPVPIRPPAVAQQLRLAFWVRTKAKHSDPLPPGVRGPSPQGLRGPWPFRQSLAASAQVHPLTTACSGLSRLTWRGVPCQCAHPAAFLDDSRAKNMAD